MFLGQIQFWLMVWCGMGNIKTGFTTGKELTFWWRIPGTEIKIIEIEEKSLSGIQKILQI